MRPYVTILLASFAKKKHLGCNTSRKMNVNIRITNIDIKVLTS